MRDLDPQAMALAFDGLDCGTESFLAEEVPLLSVGGVSGYLKSLRTRDPRSSRTRA